MLNTKIASMITGLKIEEPGNVDVPFRGWVFANLSGIHITWLLYV